jgi:multidrug transporter EmrE-like cation transporter
MSLPVVVVLSVCGMITIKTGEMRHDMIILTTGLAFEGIAFLIYPMSMRVYPLRTITVCWSGGSVVASVLAGYLYFNETPTLMSLIGCMTVVVGIGISVISV